MTAPNEPSQNEPSQDRPDPTAFLTEFSNPGPETAAERHETSRIDPGPRALVVAIAVLILVASFALPHTGSARGWDVLGGDSAAIANSIALPSRIFTWLALVFGVVFSMLALVTTRWVLAWVALAGCVVATIFGLLSVWSRQTISADLPGGGPGIGLILGWIALAVLSFHWLKVVWIKTNRQLAAQEQRRVASANVMTVPKLRQPKLK